MSYAANQQNVKSLLDNLKELKLKDTIDSGKNQYATYELDDDKSVHVQVFKDADKALDLYFGKSGTRGQMTRVSDKDGVYVASGYSSYLYTREVKDWRDRDVMKFEDANVIAATITNENGAFSFSKNDEKWTRHLQGQADPQLRRREGERLAPRLQGAHRRRLRRRQGCRRHRSRQAGDARVHVEGQRRRAARSTSARRRPARAATRRKTGPPRFSS